MVTCLFILYGILKLDIGACEAVLKAKTKEDFERRLRAEHGG